jgi:hypothetical protein
MKGNLLKPITIAPWILSVMNEILKPPKALIVSH